MTVYTYDEALEASVDYFNGNRFAAKIFVDKYALRNTEDQILEATPDAMHRRIANEFARIELGKAQLGLFHLDVEEIYDMLKEFGKLIPQGSPLYGIGNQHQYVTLSNCYALEPPVDSYGGIHFTDEQITQVSKRRGGTGIDLSHLRPAGTATHNSSRTSTGMLSWMDRYSHSAREVGQHGRRGALMLTLNVHHPQILDFIHSKDDGKSITGANISVKLTDEFLEAVKHNQEYEQRWPIDSDTPVISHMVNAKEIWNEIVKSAWFRAEPGVLFWDHTLRESPADCYADFGFRTVSPNPCSEILLSANDACRLLAINLFSCVIKPFEGGAFFDFDMLYQLAYNAQILMDDLVDLELECIDRLLTKIEGDPEPAIIKERELYLWQQVQEKTRQGRRTGTGITALADAMAAIGITYGSRKSLYFVEKVYRTLKNGAYRASVDLAKSLGPFPIWDKNLEKNNSYLLRLKKDFPETWEDMQKYGRRNIALLTTSPGGTISNLAKIGPYFGTSSGIEPVYQTSFVRRKKGNPGDKDFRTDFIDPSGDHWMEFEVYHSGLKLWMDTVGESDSLTPEQLPYHNACAYDIDWKARVNIQATAQKHIDHGISSTINLPEDIELETVDKLYRQAMKSGVKGITVYRQNCRTGVLIDPSSIQHHTAPQRPKELPCDVYHITVRGTPYFVLVGMYKGEPYEVFCGRNGNVGKGVKNGTIIKMGRPKQYKAIFEDGSELCPITLACTDEEEVVTRLASLNLRGGVSMHQIVQQLEKTQGDLTSFSKSITRALKKYIPDGTHEKGKCPQCHSESLVREAGCMVCKSCTWSACS